MVRKKQSGEEGFLLIAVLFALALVMFALAMAAPRVTQDLQRDREEETIHRGMQYARAIQLYYRKFGHYPVSVDELVSSNHMRFLRRKYTDPMTGRDDWRLIHFGQAKTMRGAGGTPNQVGTPAAAVGLSGGTGGTTDLTPGSVLNQGGPGSQTGLGPGSQTGLGPGVGPNGGPGNGIVVGTAGGGQDAGPPGTQVLTNTLGPGSQTGLSDLANGGPPGANVGGGPIVGVSSTNTKASIKVLKKMEHYNDWEFIYDPSLDTGGAGAAGGVPGGAVVQPGVGNQPQPGQNGPGGFGSSPSPGPGAGPGVTPTPTPPQDPNSPNPPQ